MIFMSLQLQNKWFFSNFALNEKRETLLHIDVRPGVGKLFLWTFRLQQKFQKKLCFFGPSAHYGKIYQILENLKNYGFRLMCLIIFGWEFQN